MYSYHNRIKQRIKNGELINHYFTKNYPNIGEALVLVFCKYPFLRPIRPHKWHEYVDILAEQKGGDLMQLFYLRTKEGWSQEFVARKMEVSRQTVINWEDGKSIPTADKAIRLAKIFGVTVEKLME